MVWPDGVAPIGGIGRTNGAHDQCAWEQWHTETTDTQMDMPNGHRECRRTHARSQAKKRRHTHTHTDTVHMHDRDDCMGTPTGTDHCDCSDRTRTRRGRRRHSRTRIVPASRSPSTRTSTAQRCSRVQAAVAIALSNHMRHHTTTPRMTHDGRSNGSGQDGDGQAHAAAR